MQIHQAIILTNTMLPYIFVVNSSINIINENYWMRENFPMQVRRPNGVSSEREPAQWLVEN